MKYWDKLDRKLRMLIIAMAFLLILFIASKVAFWCLVFIVAASISDISNNHFRTPIHIDISKLGTIMTSVAYGAGVGIFVGLSSTIFSKIFSSRIDARILPSIFGIALIAVLADAFSEVSITLLGALLVLLYYAVVSPINMLMGTEPGYAFIYILTSLVSSFILFMHVAPRIIGLL